MMDYNQNLRNAGLITLILELHDYISLLYMIKIIILLIVLFDQAKVLSQISSPFNMATMNVPSGIERLSHQLIVGQTRTFTATLANSYNNTPIVIYAISSLQLKRGLNYNLSLTKITLTSIQGTITANSTVIKAKLLFLSLNSDYFKINFFNYQYKITEAIDQTVDHQIKIPDHQTYDASFLVGIQIVLGSVPSGYSPLVNSTVLDSTSTVIPTQLSITYTPKQIKITYLYMYFIKVDTNLFKTPPFHSGSGQKLMIYGTNGIATDITNVPITYQTYQKNYFVGLQAIYDNQFAFTNLSFDILNSQYLRMNYYVSELIFGVYNCPSNFPYMNNDRSLCYNQCQFGWYGNDQYICRPCNTNCRTCFKYDTYCTTCNSPHTLVYGYKCGCQNGTFSLVTQTGLSCQKCDQYIPNCLQCSNSTVCTKCKNNLVLLNSTICQCPIDTRKLIVNGVLFCISNPPGQPYKQKCNNDLTINSYHCYCNTTQNMTFTNKTCS